MEKEVFLDPHKVIMSTTNHKGVIQSVNDFFIEICGYSQEELIGKPHNIIRHPDMPKVIFKTLWEKLNKGENLYAVVKNLTKSGDYYWVVTKFVTSFDNEGNIIAHHAKRKAVPKKVKALAKDLYATILKIEKHDEKLAEDTFHEILKDYDLTYDDFFLELAGMNEATVLDYFLGETYNTNAPEEDVFRDIYEQQQLKKKKSNTSNSKSFFGDKTELSEALKNFRAKTS